MDAVVEVNIKIVVRSMQGVKQVHLDHHHHFIGSDEALA